MLRLHSLLSLVHASFVITIFGVTSAAHADELYWIDPSTTPKLTKCDLANGMALTVTPILNLAVDERVTGMTTPYPALVGVPLAPKSDARVLIETVDGEHRNASLNFGSATVSKTGLLKEGAIIYGAKGLVNRSFGLFVPFPGNSGEIEYNLIVNEFGDFIQPGGLKGTSLAATKLVKGSALTDPIVSIGKSPSGPIIVLAEGAKYQLHFFQYSASPGVDIAFKKMDYKVVDVTCPSPYCSILGFTMAQDHQIYAIVNRTLGLSGHQWGDLLLCRGKVANKKLNLTQLSKIGTWGGGIPFQGPYQMLVKKT